MDHRCSKTLVFGTPANSTDKLGQNARSKLKRLRKFFALRLTAYFAENQKYDKIGSLLPFIASAMSVRRPGENASGREE
jgi:hypothetical protein